MRQDVRQKETEMVEVEGQGLGLLTVEQLAHELAVTPKTIRRWRGEKQAPKSIRVGRRIFFRIEDVQAWLSTQAEEQAEAQGAGEP